MVAEQYLFWGISECIIVEVLHLGSKFGGYLRPEIVTHCSTIIAKELSADTPEVIAVGTCSKRRVRPSARRSFNEFLRDGVCFLPLLLHLLA